MNWVDTPFNDQINWVEVPFDYVGVPATTVAPPTVIYTPSAPWKKRNDITIYRGSGLRINFIQEGTPIAINAAHFEARLGLDGAEPIIRFNTTNGRLTDLGSGVLSVNPTSEETEALPTTGRVVLELWRINSDDAKTVVGKAWVNVAKSINP